MRSDRRYLQDILSAIDEARAYLPSDRATFDSDRPVQSHILWQVQIIGEAAFRISRATKDSNPHIPWRQIAGIRHILVHDYFRTDFGIVFQTTANDLPPLRPLIEAILSTLPPDPP